MPYSNMLPTLMSNPQQQVSGGLLSAFTPYQQGSLSAPPAVGASLTAGMGPWSQLAYQMAGRPKQGGAYAAVTPPPTPASDASGSGGGSTAGSLVTGLLGSVLKNPQLLKGAYNGITGLLGGGSIPAGVAAEGNAAAAAANAATGAYAADGAANVSVLPSVSGALDAAPAASGGLLASAGAAPIASGAGSIGSGTAAASTTASGAGGLGLAGAAIPLAAAAVPFLIGLNGAKANDQGNAAYNAWIKATGGKWVGTTTPNGNSQFGITPTQLKGGVDTGYVQMPDGSKLTKAQAQQAIAAWAKTNGMSAGNLGG